MKIYFDANIWIDYTWGVLKSKRPKAQIRNLITHVTGSNFTVISSVFALTEVSAHFKDWYTLQKITKAGYSYRELSNLKREPIYSKLTKRETNTIDSYLESINQTDWVEFVELQNLDKEALDLFTTLTLEYHLEFADAFHIVLAMNEGCRYLVTKDSTMRQQSKKFIEDYELRDDFNILNISELLQIS